VGQRLPRTAVPQQTSGTAVPRRFVSIAIAGDAWCRASDKTYRLDTPAARAFLDDLVRLP
jgi:hypothetical protein